MKKRKKKKKLSKFKKGVKRIYSLYPKRHKLRLRRPYSYDYEENVVGGQFMFQGGEKEE